MQLKAKLFVCLMFCVVLSAPIVSIAQTVQPEHPSVDPQCVTDDENFTRLYDLVALVSSLTFFLIIPLALPVVPTVANRWWLASPVARWICGVLLSILGFILPFFLLPQLARVSESFRPWGLWAFNSLGNIRFEYLQCDVQSIPKDYGLFFWLRWNPGPSLTISYWAQLLLVFLTYALLSTGLYFAVVFVVARKRFSDLTK